MQQFPVQTHRHHHQHSAPTFAPQYQIVEVSNPVLAGNAALFQSLPSPNGTFLVPLQSHHIVQTDGQVLISQEVPILGALPFQSEINTNNCNQGGGLEASQTHLLHRHASLQQTQLLSQVQCQEPISHAVQQIQFSQGTNNTILTSAPQQTILVHDQIVQPVLVEETTVISPQQSTQQQTQQIQSQQQQFLVVDDVGTTAEVVEFTDAGTQTILSALSQGETPAISINGDIVGYVNCAEIKSDGAIVFTIGGDCQQKSDISNFLEFIDKKKDHRDAQSWFFDSVVATQAMQALISKGSEMNSTLPVSGIRRQVH